MIYQISSIVYICSERHFPMNNVEPTGNKTFIITMMYVSGMYHSVPDS